MYDLTVADLFAGSGGLSLGFENTGYKTIFAVERDSQSAITYKLNRKRKKVKLIEKDINLIDFRKLVKELNIKKEELDVLLCGPPCQGYSFSNMRTRSNDNPLNDLYNEFLRSISEIMPKWVLFENVPGILNFGKGKIIMKLQEELYKLGYLYVWSILDSVEYGIPQRRRRLFLIGNIEGKKFIFPNALHGKNKLPFVRVKDAIADLKILSNGNKINKMQYRLNYENATKYQKMMRKGWDKNYSYNNLVTKNSDLVLQRYEYLKPGANWQQIPNHLLANYKNKKNCHSGIYRRLEWDNPSIVISNFRKNMLIHPDQDRGLSVREAARLQSFPDRYIFYGSLGSQQQQVADAVPPILAKILGRQIKKHIRGII